MYVYGMNVTKLFTPKQLSQLLGVTQQTLTQWEKEGRIKAQKTQGGHRRYEYIETFADKKQNDKQSFLYARVSSYKQQSDLQRQIDLLQAKYPSYEVIKDIGSGINFKRKGLLALLEAVFAGRVQKVVVAFRARLTRFGFELFEYIFQRFNVSIEVLSDSDVNEPVNELAKDLLSIVTVFTARYYGQRSYHEMQKDQDLPKRSSKRFVQQMPRRIKVFLQPNSRQDKRNWRERNFKTLSYENSGDAK